MRRYLFAAAIGTGIALSTGVHAQTVGCEAVTGEAASAAQAEIDYLRANVRKPQTVTGLTCLNTLLSVTSLSADALVLSALDQVLGAIVGQVCNALNNYWTAVINQLRCGLSVSGVGLGFLSGLGGGTICQFNVNLGGGYGQLVGLNAGIGPNGGGYYINGMADGVAGYGQ